MRISKALLGISLLIPVLSMAAGAQKAKGGKKYAAEGTPTRAIQELDDKLEAYILNPKTDQDRAFNANLKKEIISGIFDVGELCRLALDKHWGEITEADQTSFVDLMTRLLERKGIFSKEQSKERGKEGQYFLTYSGEKFIAPDKLIALVVSYVNVPSERLKIELDYKMKKVANGWKIYDVVVDQASLLDNYRYQFDKIISKDGYPDLYRRMESKLKEMEAKEKEKGQS